MFTKGLLQNLQFYVRPANPLTMDDAINVARSFEDSYKSVNIQPAVPMNHFTQPPVFQPSQAIPNQVVQDITKVLKDLSEQVVQMKRATIFNQRNGSTNRHPNFQPRREFQNNN